MISITKNFNNIPISLTSPACMSNLASVINSALPNHKDNISNGYYGHPTVVNRLKAIYHNKCAYCETYEPDPEVEHYRPKKRVRDVPGHPGYYWLCYEWSNLMPACHDCNKNGAKGNYFPVDGTRQTLPPLTGTTLNQAECLLLSNSLSVVEIPLLINPEVPGFDPYHYFFVDEKGEIKERQAAGTLDFRKAHETIKIVRLNRDKLFLNLRRKQIRYYMQRVRSYIYLFLKGDKSQQDFENSIFEILKEIQTRTGATHEYSFFWSYFYRNFNNFISFYIKPKYRPRIFGLVQAYKMANP